MTPKHEPEVIRAKYLALKKSEPKPGTEEHFMWQTEMEQVHWMYFQLRPEDRFILDYLPKLQNGV